MSILDKAKDVKDKAKKVAQNTMKFVRNVGKTIKFLATPVGQVIGIIIAILFLIILIYVLMLILKNTLKIWFDDDGNGSPKDYETIIASIGYAGYDSFITEQALQEYTAFEYAVLMDVAEHMYKYQDYRTEIQNNDVEGGSYITSAVMPEGIVESQYDAGSESISLSDWQSNIIKAQKGDSVQVKNKDTKYYPGGNRDVITPRLIYELADSENSETAMSLEPYLVVVREDIDLNYFITGFGDATWQKYNNSEPIDYRDLEADTRKIEPVRFSAELNRFNNNLPVSGYKKDLSEDVKGNLVLGVEDPNGFVEADRVEGYGDEIYHTEQETNIVYKIPLKILINRYLPKVSLLTTWHMLKGDGGSGDTFNIEELMDTIMDVYNSACYNGGMDKAKEITSAMKLNPDTGELENVPKVTLRKNGTDGKKEGIIPNSLQFDENGNIIRDEDGTPILADKTIQYDANYNRRTFIYFEQFGLETNRYEKFVAYKDANGDEAMPQAVSPTATYLTMDRVNFIKSLNITIKRVPYKKCITVPKINATGETEYEEYCYVDYTDVAVKLKPFYILDSGTSGTGELIDEKLKNNYLFENQQVEIFQPKREEYMIDVVDRAEKSINNIRVYEEGDNDEMIYDHYIVNSLYLPADVGNTNEGVTDTNQMTYDAEKIKFKLPEDFRYYNQNDMMPHWYDLRTSQAEVENAYLKAFSSVYLDSKWYAKMEKLIKDSSPIIDDGNFAGLGSGECVYTYESAPLYNSGKHNTAKATEIRDGAYGVNYYWQGVYVIEEQKLQMRQTIHQTRMPVALVKYCDTWAKSVEYNNRIVQNPFEYNNFRYLIPESTTSLGLVSMNLNETAHYRVDQFKKFYNSTGDNGLKEADILDMLIQWEQLGDKGNEEAYAFMRDLYKLTLFIKEEQMLEGAYSYLYIPSTISNFDDATTQKIFWLERFAASKGEDELSEDEQKVTRTKGNEIYWQNLEYDEYDECLTYGWEDVDGDGNMEEVPIAKVYALFPYGSPVVRSYCMLNNIDSICSQPFGGGHDATDLCSRACIKQILSVKDRLGSVDHSTEERIYKYELNRLTQKYMNVGNVKKDALFLAEKELNDTLEQTALYSPIVAIAPGYVSQVDYDSRSGFYVKIIHDYKINSGDDENQITSLYCHLKRWPLVDVGDFVGAGTILGYEGTTGRSTGYHLHFAVEVDGKAADPHEYTTPIYTPFYYNKKSEAVLKEDESKALGSEYYTLERTILLDERLANKYNIINGMKSSTGTTIKYEPLVTSAFVYHSGDNYFEDTGYNNLIWGNNVPQKPLADNLENIMDLNLLHQTIPFEMNSGDKGDGKTISSNKVVTANPNFYTESSVEVEERLSWPKFFVAEMAEYKSDLVVPNYNGPRSINEEITEEGMEDLKAIQASFKRAGFYNRAKISSKETAFENYGAQFEEVVKYVQQYLIDKGYKGVSVTGKLDDNTISAYNSYVQYTKHDNQLEMSKRISYNSSVDVSIEPALIWAIASVDSDFLSLKEAGGNSSGRTLEYKYYSTNENKYITYNKNFNKSQGIMQIPVDKAIEKMKEDGIEAKDAVLYIRSPLRNTNIGVEMLKEYAIKVYEKYANDINSVKNSVIFYHSGPQYWQTIYDESSDYSKKWVDGKNIDMIMLYAIALDAYDKGSVESVDVGSMLSGGPTGYAKDVLEKYKEFILDQK